MHNRRPWLAAILVSGFLTFSLASIASAHVVKDFGKYSVALGWLHEPTYVGQENAVQVIVKTKAGKPVTDLSGEDLRVVVSTGAQKSDPLALEPTFDEDTGLGTPGEYVATIVPTAPGDYTFHLTGTIHGQKVDETVTSGEKTFETVKEATPIQFPAKVPSANDVATRLDRIDARIAALQASPGPNGQGSASDAAKAEDTAYRALLLGAGLGALGTVLGLVALTLAARARRAARS